MSGKKVGYIRVSSYGQNDERQLDGIKLDKIFVRPGKVVYFSGCEARSGRSASHRIASLWRLYGNIEL